MPGPLLLGTLGGVDQAGEVVGPGVQVPVVRSAQITVAVPTPIGSERRKMEMAEVSIDFGPVTAKGAAPTPGNDGSSLVGKVKIVGTSPLRTRGSAHRRR